jgi:arsenate reductase-like glutaredoxin family protein
MSDNFTKEFVDREIEYLEQMEAKAKPASSFAAPTGLDALFEKYVTADTEAREICEELQKSSRAFNDACSRRDAAWEEYNNAKKQSASNSVITDPVAKPKNANVVDQET